MKRFIALILILLINKSGEAQVLINLQLPATGIYLKSQLWNLTVINLGALNTNVKIDMTFTDVANNQLVFTASSKTFTLSQQVTQLQLVDLSPVLYNVVNNNYNVDANPAGFLPVGQFEVCFAIMKVNLETFEKLTEECDFIDVEPLSPPILLDPANEETVDVLRPIFSWIPPAPAGSFNGLSYDWVLVELNGFQTAADAIQQNTPVHSVETLGTNSFLYPPSLPELDTSKTYAWQVAAKSSNNAIAKTEVWTFRVKKYGLDSSQIINQKVFIPLRTQNDASYATVSGAIRYHYLNEVNDSAVAITLFDITTSSRIIVTPEFDSVALKFGENFIEMPELPGMQDKHIYLLELINSKDERWLLKFEYRKPEEN